MPQQNPNRSSQPIVAAPLTAGRCRQHAPESILPPGSDAPLNSGARRAWVAAALLAISIGAVYGRALDAPFIFDDGVAITGNESIFSLWPLIGSKEHPGPLNPAQDVPLSGRPLVNLSLAINHYFGGLNPTGYHAVNVALHFFSALLVWAIVRRTLLLPYFADRFATSADWLALAVAMLWALHPLQTEAVIYVTQRTELMMALFYLATLYCSLRYWESHGIRLRRTRWLILAVFACLCGMASKEVMVSAPLMVLLFERTFVAGSLLKALGRSWPIYAGLAATWLLLLILNISVPRGETAGFGLGVSGWAWWLTQCQALLMYLKLTVWPWPLLIHYEWPYLTTFAEAWMYAIPVLLLGIVTLVLLWRNQPFGYLGTWVFAILSPTLVIPILTEMAAERRMYLPLVALVVLFVVGGHMLAQSLLNRWVRDRRVLLGFSLLRVITAMPAFLLAIAFGLLSTQRLTAYYDEMDLWQEVLQHQPKNHIAHNNLGVLLNKAGRPFDAIDTLEAALALKPNYTDALQNLGNALTDVGRLPEAVDSLRAALALQPDNPMAHNNLGIALVMAGRVPEAIEQLEQALRLNPNYADAYNNLGIALSRSGKIPEAIEQFRQALQLNQNHANAHYNLGNILTRTGDVDDAIAHVEQAVRLQPDSADIHNILGELFRQTGRPQQAIEHYQAALRLDPDYVPAYANLCITFNLVNRSEEAIATAQHGIEVARSAGQEAAAEQLEEWLTHYRIELRRSEEAAAQPPSPSTK